jgi:hypothetical protein
MPSTRLIVYSTLAILATLVLADTNIGWSVSHARFVQARQAIYYLDRVGLSEDAHLVSQIADSRGFRSSIFFHYITQAAKNHGEDFSYYAYTPILSGTKIFLGPSFWQVGVIGRSSILTHEAAHVRRHQSRLLRGLPRSRDEEAAYSHQYHVYPTVRIGSDTPDGIVYWDMMMGIEMYVLPVHPGYASRLDVKESLEQLSDIVPYQ